MGPAVIGIGGCGNPNCPSCGGQGVPLDEMFSMLFGGGPAPSKQQGMPIVRALSGRYIGGPGLGVISAADIEDLDRQMTESGVPPFGSALFVPMPGQDPRQQQPLLESFLREVEALQSSADEITIAQSFIEQFVQLGESQSSIVLSLISMGSGSPVKLVYRILAAIQKGGVHDTRGARNELKRMLTLKAAGSMICNLGSDYEKMRILADAISTSAREQAAAASDRTRSSMPRQSHHGRAGTRNGTPAGARRGG